MNEVLASPAFHAAVFLGISIFLGFVYTLQPISTDTLGRWQKEYAVRRQTVVGVILPPPQFIRYSEAQAWMVWGWFLVPFLANMGLWSLPSGEHFLNVGWFLLLGVEVWLGLWLRRRRCVRLSADWLRYLQLTEPANRFLEGVITDQTGLFDHKYYGRQISVEVVRTTTEGQAPQTQTYWLFVFPEADIQYNVRRFQAHQMVVRIIYRPYEARDLGSDGLPDDSLPKGVSGVVLSVELMGWPFRFADQATSLDEARYQQWLMDHQTSRQE